MDFKRKQKDLINRHLPTEIGLTQPIYSVPTPNQLVTIGKKIEREPAPLVKKNNWKGLIWGIITGMTLGSLVFYFFLIQPTIFSYLVDQSSKGSSSSLVLEEKAISTNSKLISEHYNKLQKNYTDIQSLGCGNITKAINDKTLSILTLKDSSVNQLFTSNPDVVKASYLVFNSQQLNSIQEEFLQSSKEFKKSTISTLIKTDNLYPYLTLVARVDSYCDTLSKSVLKLSLSEITTICTSLKKDVDDYTKISISTTFESQVSELLKGVLDLCDKQDSSVDFQKEFFIFYDKLTAVSYKINDQKLEIQDNFELYAKNIQWYREKMNELFNSKQSFPNQFYFLF